MRVIIDVAGYRTGPIAAGQLARVAEAAGAWGLAFESDEVGAESFALHAAAAATTELRVIAWLRGSPFVAAEQLSVLDWVTNGRAAGMTRDEREADRVEAILSGAEVPAGDDGLGGRTPTTRLAPPPVQPSPPVLRRAADGSVSHPRLSGLARVALPAEQLLVPGVPLTEMVRSARLSGWEGPEIEAVRALG